MSDWDTMLGEAALGRDLVPLDRVRGEPAHRPLGLMLIDQPRVRPGRLASASPEAIFRAEALAFRARGHDVPGGVVRLGSRWIRWTYRAMLVLVLAAVASMWVIRTGESTSGPAVVEGPAGTVTVLLPAAVAPDLARSQVLTVVLPNGLSIRGTGLRVRLAGAAAIRAAGFAPQAQPAILVTGRLAPGEAAAAASAASAASAVPAASAVSAGQDPRLRAQASVVLRSESLADVLARQFGAVLGLRTVP